MTIATILSSLIALCVGAIGGYIAKQDALGKKQLQEEAKNAKTLADVQSKVKDAQQKTREILLSAESKKKDILQEAKEKATDITQAAQQEADKKERDLEKQEVRMEQKEEDLTKKVEEIQKQREGLSQKEKTLDEKKAEYDEMIQEEAQQIEKIAHMTQEEAEKKLFDIIEKTKEEKIISKMKKAERESNERAEEVSREIIAHAIQKYASEVTFEATQTTLQIENDDMKGRIIGREGRNINAFERATGVDVIVDDTPGAVIISGFDLLRRFIAKKALQKLLEDGRIHPARIEEVVTKVTIEVDKMIQDFGEKALEEVGIAGVPPEIVKILGRLRFRTSHGQNVLRHSIEMAFLAEEIAHQIGADPERAKMAALFHDLGKSVSHEVGGKHALISGEIGRKFGLDPLVINAMEAHHEDVEKLCTEAYIVQAADAISASRPGARRDTTEQYVKRLKKQEELVRGFRGVKKTYMMSAGRDMWVFVDPKKVSDLESMKMADDIAQKLEAEMSYPGEIKVVIFRETRAQAIAH